MADRAVLQDIATQDVTELMKKDASYGGSWKRRGGVGAFMMLARKWDRLEKQCEEQGYDVFKAVLQDDSIADGVIDDLRDLRRYLMLVESHVHEVQKTAVKVSDDHG